MDDGGYFGGSFFRKLPYPLASAFLIALHFGAVRAGHLILDGNAQNAPMWPAAALGLGTLLVFGLRYWPVLFAAYIASGLQEHQPWLACLGIAMAGVARASVGVWIFRLASKCRDQLGPFEDMVTVGLICVFVPLASAVIGPASQVWAGLIPAHQWPFAFERWWIADALGLATAMPVLVLAARDLSNGTARIQRVLAFETVAFTCLVAAGCYFIFFQPEGSYLLFSVFFLILVAAAWLGPFAARLSALVVALLAIWATRIGVGVFAGESLTANLRNLDLFLVAVSLTGMVLGVERLAVFVAGARKSPRR
jgi:integral membrane sensor domain MASE1